MRLVLPSTFFFFNDTATTEIYTLSLHDALPICIDPPRVIVFMDEIEKAFAGTGTDLSGVKTDRKSTRLNSSHLVISYAVFCLKKKKISIRLVDYGGPLPRDQSTVVAVRTVSSDL